MKKHRSTSHILPHIAAVMAVVTVAIMVFCLIPSTALAAGNGDDSGGGNSSGDNRDIPLLLKKCSVATNAEDIPVDKTIQLTFNKNVCDITVLSNNRKCFHLIDETGTSVPVRIIFPDTQLQQDYKRQVFLIPLTDLQSYADYTVTVDSSLSAKNGKQLDKDYSFRFTTGSQHDTTENPILKVLGENIVTYQSSGSEEEGNAAPASRTGLDPVPDSRVSDSSALSVIILIVILLMLAAFTAFLIIAKRRRG